MIGNLIILLIVIGLVVLFGWLMYRAVHAQRQWVKIVGGLLAGLMILILTAVAMAGGRGMVQLYSPDVPPAPQLTVVETPEKIARGEYLVNIACIGCHGAVDAEGNPTGQLPLTGGWNVGAAEGFGFAGDMIADNLTPGSKLASYSDGELFRAIRYRVNQDGHRLMFMEYEIYHELSDGDVEAIIAYLRSLPAVESAIAVGDKATFLAVALMGAGIFPAPEPSEEHVTAPSEGITAEYGKYVATFGGCRSCHGPNAMGVAESSLGPAVPNPRHLVNTLSQTEFMEMMRTGIRPGSGPFPETMPWQSAAKMTDDDLAALYAYLTTEP